MDPIAKEKSQAYQEASVREPNRVFDFDKAVKHLKYHVVIHETHSNRPIVWAIPNLLTKEESGYVVDQMACQGLVYGKEVPHQFLVEDASDKEGRMIPLSDAIFPRLQEDYNQLKSLRGNNDDVSDHVNGLSKNWRVLKLGTGEEFPAHIDTMDTVKDGEECKVSTHSVLLDFHCDCTGAIRLYYRQYPSDGPYEYCVDVNLPRGWGLVMEQRPDLYYALQPIQASQDVQHVTPDQQIAPARFVAQTGMLQTLEPGQTSVEMRKGCVNTFCLGPGLLQVLEEEVERNRGEDAPRGWGNHAASPKSTLWKDGKPIIKAKQSEKLNSPGQREHDWFGGDEENCNNDNDSTKPTKAARRKPTQDSPLSYQEAYVGEPDRVFNYDKEITDLKKHVVVYETHSNKPIVWVIPNLLTQEETGSLLDQVASQGVLYGKEVPNQFHIKDINNEEGTMIPLSDALCPRLQEDYNQLKSLRGNNDDVSDHINGVSKNWRVLKLRTGQEFPAHIDTMDTLKDGEECSVSTHSLLLDFHRGCAGAIRFYYRQYPSDGPYDYYVDVNLPRGWGVVMEQRPDLYYAIQPMQTLHDVQQIAPTRFVAQTGMLQTLEPGQTAVEMRKGCVNTFLLGPGLLQVLEEEVERHRGEDAPRGWGSHKVSSKSTLWKDGKPIIKVKRLERRHSTAGLRERTGNEENGNTDKDSSADATNKAVRKRPTRRLSLQAQVDPAKGEVKYVEIGNPVTANKKKEKGKKQHSSLHERLGSSLADFTKRDRKQRRRSLGGGGGAKAVADPSRRRATCVLPGLSEKRSLNGDDSFDDTSESTGMMEDLSVVSAGGRRTSISVTRKPRKESLVGKLMNSFQTKKSSEVTADV